MDFIHHFVKLYSEKRSDLEEQQFHLKVGLNKIAETLQQVEEMQKSLAVKSQELQQKNEAANSKLKQMFKDQQEAEKKKIQSQEIQIQLAEQTVTIEEKRKYVMADLAQVEPAVQDAQQGKCSLIYKIYKPSRGLFSKIQIFSRKIRKEKTLNVNLNEF